MLDTDTGIFRHRRDIGQRITQPVKVRGRFIQRRGNHIAQVRDLCINLLRDVMSERGVQQRPLASTLQELQRICDALNHHHQPAARELAAAIWRLYCALSQLEQAPVAGTIGEGTT